MFIPLKDINPSRSYPFVNISLIAANVALFFYELSLQFSMTPKAFAALLATYSTVPARLPSFFAGHGTFQMTFFPIVTSMFLHSGFLHLDAQLGQQVETGERLGTVFDSFGKTLRLVRADRTGIVIGRSEAPVVNGGDAVVHIASTAPD